MSYINLTLKNLDELENKLDTFSNIIKHDKNDVIIILGSPGSGKTSMLKKFEESNKNTSFQKVKDFLKLDKKTKKNLLLDGLDEYRSLENDKVFVVKELGCKLSKTKYNKVVISCRELDWYGDTDKNSLSNQIKKNVSLYKVCTLSEKQKNRMAKLLGIPNPISFISKYNPYGFLDNPQLFTMIADIHSKDSNIIAKTKKDLYIEYVRLSKEKNISYQINKLNDLSEDERFKYAGYLSCFYLFSNIEIFSDDVLDKISSESHNIEKGNLQTVIKTNLFDGNKKIIHRSIGEFLAAYFLVNFNNSKNTLFEFIYELFIKKDRVPTELRGTYAWICSLSLNDNLINIDPYYQSMYGDNSFFDNTFKKKIIKQVRIYSIKDPYFYKFGQIMNLEQFYDIKLDGFLIKEFKKALKFDNHYIRYIISILSSTHSLSSSIIEFIKLQMLDFNVKTYIKVELIDILKGDLEFLYLVLNKIKKNMIADDRDELKDRLLDHLYLKKIPSSEIIDYLILYNENDNNRIVGHSYYLHNTPYSEKFYLVDKIYSYYQVHNESEEHELISNYNFNSFCKEYFLEIILKFEDDTDGLTAKEIFDILLHFNSYYKEYYTMSYESFHYTLQDKEKASEEKLQKLANKLYNLYVDYQISNSKINNIDLYFFQNFFSYRVPTKQRKILFSKLNKINTPEQNRILFKSGVYALRDQSNKVIIDKKIKKLAVEYGFEKELELIINPAKQDWERRREKREKEEKEKTKKIIRKNEKFYDTLTDKQILKNFNALHYISDILYFKEEKFEKFLTYKTFNRLKNLIKDLLYVDKIDSKLLTIKSLIETGDARRNIDILYYVSICLNENLDFKKLDKTFIKYLYLNCLFHSNTGGIRKTNFIDEFHKYNRKFENELLKEYIKKVLIHNDLDGSFYMKYIENEQTIEKLRHLAKSRGSNLGSFKNIFIFNFLQEYNFKLYTQDLNVISSIKELSPDNKNIIKALLVFNFESKSDYNIDIAVALYSLFDHRGKEFIKLNTILKIKYIYVLMSAFRTENSIKHKSGIQSTKDMCASFLVGDAFSLKDINIYISLEKKLKNTIWENRLKNKIRELEQIDSDESYTIYSTTELKANLFKTVKKNKTIFIFQPNWNGMGLNRLPTFKEIKNIPNLVKTFLKNLRIKYS